MRQCAVQGYSASGGWLREGARQAWQRKNAEIFLLSQYQRLTSSNFAVLCSTLHLVGEAKINVVPSQRQ